MSYSKTNWISDAIIQNMQKICTFVSIINFYIIFLVKLFIAGIVCCNNAEPSSSNKIPQIEKPHSPTHHIFEICIVINLSFGYLVIMSRYRTWLSWQWLHHPLPPYTPPQHSYTHIQTYSLQVSWLNVMSHN